MVAEKKPMLMPPGGRGGRGITGGRFPGPRMERGRGPPGPRVGGRGEGGREYRYCLAIYPLVF